MQSVSGKPNMEQIWNEVSSSLKKFILSKIENEADASDILQDTFLKIHGNIHSLKDQYRLKSWIYQIARNQINDHFRTNKRSKNIDEIPNDLTFPDSSDRLMDRAISNMVGMMEELSPEYCEALCMTEIDGMSQKEYAEVKGLSYSGAKSRVQRARMILKEMLMKCCHYQFDKYGSVIDIQAKCCCCCPEKNITR